MMKFKWTIPNILTIFRALLAVPILLLISRDSLFNMSLALGLFLVSALTDGIDGFLARKLNQTSEFGAFFDPVADKLLVWGVYTVFAFTQGLFIPLWLIAFIYLRDLFVTALRSYSKKKKIKFKTSLIAKAKTLVQMVVAFTIMLYMLITFIVRKVYSILSMNYSEIWRTVLPDHYNLVIYIPAVLCALTVLFTIYTAIDYYLTFKNNRQENEK